MAVGSIAGEVSAVEEKTSQKGAKYQYVSVIEKIGEDKTQKVTWVNFSNKNGEYFFNPRKGDIIVVDGAVVSASAYQADGEARPTATLSFARGNARLLYRPVAKVTAADVEVEDAFDDPIDDL